MAMKLMKRNHHGVPVDTWSKCDMFGEELAISECSLDDKLRLAIGRELFYLDQSVAAELIPLLQRFVETGRLGE